MEARNTPAPLANIRLRLIQMGAQVEGMVAAVTRALVDRNPALAADVIAQDDAVDHLELAIDDACHSVLARYQPTACDMRFLVAALKITADLERMGDSAVNIAHAVHELQREAPLAAHVDLQTMSVRVQEMVRQSLDAFVERDTALAARVCAADDEVYRRYKAIFCSLVERLRADRDAAPRAVHLLLAARNLERIGDHATNVAEEVVFFVDGRDIRHAHGAHHVGEGSRGEAGVAASTSIR
jgi:phosphate transport system protein